MSYISVTVFRPYKDSCFLWFANVKPKDMMIGSGNTLCWNIVSYKMSKCTGVCGRRDENCLPTKTKDITIKMECADGEKKIPSQLNIVIRA